MSCYTCKNFSAFKEPRQFDGYAVYGKCFKRNELFAEQYPQGLNVYIPDGTCKSYKRDLSKPKEVPPAEGQIRLEV